MGAACPECSGPTVVRPLPAELRGYLPGDPETVGICPRCVVVAPVDEPPTGPADETLPATLPDDEDARLTLVTLVTLLSSLALYREECEELVARLERRGIDPILALERLATDPDVELPFDLERRRAQLVQLLE